MIWVVLLVLAAATVAPLALVLAGRGHPRDRREAALALHRAQLSELDRDLEEGRIAAPEHAAARLEVQRRLLHEADAATPAARHHDRRPLLLSVLFLIPAVALGLYLVNGVPGMPAAPLAPRLAAAQAEAQEAARLITLLRGRLAQMDPHSEQARQGYLLLGNIEAQRQNWAGATDAWSTALKARFDPTLAVETAEAMYQRDGKLSPESQALFRRALDEAPQDAPWRKMAQARLGEEAK
jgi:cytochrome c-type biogenesis protein CcmH